MNGRIMLLMLPDVQAHLFVPGAHLYILAIISGLSLGPLPVPQSPLMMAISPPGRKEDRRSHTCFTLMTHCPHLQVKSRGWAKASFFCTVARVRNQMCRHLVPTDISLEKMTFFWINIQLWSCWNI